MITRNITVIFCCNIMRDLNKFKQPELINKKIVEYHHDNAKSYMYILGDGTMSLSETWQNVIDQNATYIFGLIKIVSKARKISIFWDDGVLWKIKLIPQRTRHFLKAIDLLLYNEDKTEHCHTPSVKLKHCYAFRLIVENNFIQIRHKLSVTIHEVRTSWKKIVRWRIQYKGKIITTFKITAFEVETANLQLIHIIFIDSIYFRSWSCMLLHHWVVMINRLP